MVARFLFLFGRSIEAKMKELPNYKGDMKLDTTDINSMAKKLAESHNIKSFDYQGYNTLDMHNSIKKIITKCRNNQGPFFLNINTYRYFEHCGPNNDDHLKYRSKKEIDFWNKKDPLNLMINNIKDKNNFFIL